MLTVGSLFAGIGGMDLGLERAGMRVVWQVEIDEWCQRVLAKHWPQVARYGDIRTVGAAELERVDVLAGGFPCQDVSKAGRGGGVAAGARSGLWSEYARLIRELRPRYVLVENVPTLLARGLDIVLADLASCGYDAEWDCISARAIGAPHLRDRIWIVAYPHDRGRLDRQARELAADPGLAAFGEPLPSGAALAYADRAGRGERWGPVAVRAENAPAQCGGEAMADPAGPGRGRAGSGGPGAASGAGAFDLPAGSSRWAVEPEVGRVAHGIPRRVDRLRGLGNAVVPQVVEWIGRRIVADADATLT